MSEINNKSITHQNNNAVNPNPGSSSETTKNDKSDKSGWLLKWTNYLKGSYIIVD